MSSITLWKDREKKIVEPTLFSSTAETMAKELSKAGGNKGTQLRRFYDEVVRLNDAAKTRQGDSIPMTLILPSLHMLIAKASYSRGRKLVSASFVTLIRDGVGQVQTKEDLQVFTSFFEALMAFYKLHGAD